MTYTSRYGNAGWASVRALEREYEKAVVEGVWEADGPRLTTANVRAIYLSRTKSYGQFDGSTGERTAATIHIDGLPKT